ncbi:N-lysine methyltransferase KMT5A-B-like [Gouania willdenowi]|uniref:N-lysine methyltransferase KMT5A-B-like n=1 Tax=Gouania willdenowi TaxID=441366 RepID=UPI001055CD6F|nr:N-lysine methyltransferase KMT5A-B-like [Gouania willdenowi]
MKQSDNVGLASHVLAKLASDSGAESAVDGTSAGHGRVRGAAHSVPGNVQMDVQAAYNRLVESHPVTLDGVVPSKAERKKFSADDQRVLYERWLKAQMKLRNQHVLAYFSRRPPAESRVASWLTKQGWKSNIPSAASIVKEWKPSGCENTVMDSSQIRKMTRTQKWKGLLVTDVEGKGKGVVATRRFQVGEVICDYHGRAITAKEGKDIHVNTSEEETGYMFFYKDKRGCCMDANTEYCECHPEMQTVGRHINHAGEGANLKTRLYTVDTDGEEKDVILFIASKHIEVNEELLFDYGVN